MIITYCILIGFLTALSVYFLLSQQLLRWIMGFVLLSATVNFVIFICGRIDSFLPAFVSEHATELNATSLANPLPQALILTAIVIAFGLFTFLIALVERVWQEFNTLDINVIRAAEKMHEEEK